MPYLPDLNTYLHQSSLLLTAYPTSRITTKYSLPRKPKPNRKPKPSPPTINTPDAAALPQRERREPSATLTLKTYHPESGICLKYQTDKAQEVGRLINGLGRLARGEEIEMSTSGAGAGADKMDVDGGAQVAVKEDDAAVGRPSTAQTQQGAVQGGGGAGGGGGGKKKKKGKGK